MKFRHLLYISRMNIPMVGKMREHPNVIHTSVSFSENTVKCQMLVCKPVASSYKHNSALKNIVVELNKDDLNEIAAGRVMQENQRPEFMAKMSELAAILEAFSMQEITDYASEHPEYYNADSRIANFNRARGISARRNRS